MCPPATSAKSAAPRKGSWVSLCSEYGRPLSSACTLLPHFSEHVWNSLWHPGPEMRAEGRTDCLRGFPRIIACAIIMFAKIHIQSPCPCTRKTSFSIATTRVSVVLSVRRSGPISRLQFTFFFHTSSNIHTKST